MYRWARTLVARRGEAFPGADEMVVADFACKVVAFVKNC